MNRLGLHVWLMAAVALPGQVNFHSVEKEAALGAGLAAEVRKQFPPLASDATLNYVERTAAALAPNLPATPWRFTFSVVHPGGTAGRTHEPLVLPGGYVFVPATLFAAAEDEGEFAGMLAHAMAHGAARHGTRQATRGQIVEVATVPLIFMGGWHGWPDSAGTLIPVGFLTFKRKFELDADTMAARALADAGYDPSALARYIARVQPETVESPNSPMPGREERLAALAQFARAAATHGAPEEFRRVRETVRGALRR